MQIDRLTQDLTKQLTKRQLQVMTHDGFSFDFHNNIFYTKDRNGRVILQPFERHLLGSARTSDGRVRDENNRLEYANSNILTSSIDWTGIGWGGTGTTATINAGRAPDGTMTANLIAQDTLNNAHFRSQSVTIFEGETYTASVYVKYAGMDQFIFGFGKSGAPFNRAWSRFRFSTQTIENFDINSPTRVTNRAATYIGDGWYRLSMTVLMNYTSTDGFWELRLSTDGSTFLGSASNAVLAWGAQLQRGKALGPHLPTTTAAVYAPWRRNYDRQTATYGLLREPARFNNLTWSQAFDNVAWTQTELTVAANDSVVFAPDNTPTADRLIESVNNAQHQIQNFAGLTVANVQNVGSCFVKANGRTKGIIRLAAATGSTIAIFDLVAKTCVSAGPSGNGTCLKATIEEWADGWFRVSCMGVPDSTSAAAFALVIGMHDAAGNNVYTGDGVSGFYVWGAQIEAAVNTLTSYVMTTTVITSRANEQFFATPSNVLNSVEGTLYCEGKAIDSANTPIMLQVDDGTNTNCIRLYRGSTAAGFDVFTGGVNQCAVVPTSFVSDDTIAKHAGSYKDNNFCAAFNGVLATKDTSGIVGAGIVRYVIGGISAVPFHIRRVDYWPTYSEDPEVLRLAT